jgi:uncharacterized membrane protein
MRGLISRIASSSCASTFSPSAFTHKVDVALGFMVVSNVYTTIGYFVHDRLWARIAWRTEQKTG